MSANHIKIVSNGTPGGTKTFIDGVELKQVIAVAFSIGVVGDAKVTIEMYADEIDIDGTVDVATKTVERDDGA